ncbi:hypothetical protein KP509_32G000100 [Ceratopteris richardii]|nr:hypothetical protein KP509_32G000100 [Ceratopteris richardii]
MIEGKTTEEIRETFHLPDDLTEEEKLEPLRNTTDDPRIRLLNRLYAKTRKELQEKEKLKGINQAELEDERSLEDLLLFINGTGEDSKSRKGGRCKKKCNHRKKKEQSKDEISENSSSSKTDPESDDAFTFDTELDGDDDLDPLMKEELDRIVKRQKLDDHEESPKQTSVIDIVSDGNSRSKPCPPHPGFLHGMCIRCGFLKPSDEEGDKHSVALRYIHAGLEVSCQEAERIKRTELQKISARRKLYLVLDLDHTLLNSARFMEVTSDEYTYLQAVYLSKEITSDQCKETGLHSLQNLQMWTKLRPFVHEFLKEASKLFELHLYTMGERVYAQTIAHILDPSGRLFGSRVISQGESTCRTTKDLDVLLGAESAVAILDDTEAVWPRHRDNLILIERYHFFGSSCKHFGIVNASLLEAEKDESAEEGTLATTLKLLQQLHTAFFDRCYQDAEGQNQHYTGEQDVRMILRTLRSRVLADCRVVFSRVFPTRLSFPEAHPLWQLAERLGATCCSSVDASVTHVVAVDKGTDKARWARENKRHLVHPRWLEAAFHIWKRPCEEDYPVDDVCVAIFSKTEEKPRPDVHQSLSTDY